MTGFTVGLSRIMFGFPAAARYFSLLVPNHQWILGEFFQGTKRPWAQFDLMLK
jgi:hypothetical protein